MIRNPESYASTANKLQAPLTKNGIFIIKLEQNLGY
jgi:hypothetical protein